jgi:glycosyltransferase involved in cell wall biosynthesis
MFLNIITPCSRPENLIKIFNSINIPKDMYRWVVVFDKDELPTNLPLTVEPHLHRNPESRNGNAQRNYGTELVTEGWILYLDDDTLLHPNLWTEIKDLDNDFIHFGQEEKGYPRLSGRRVIVEYIDSGQFIINKKIVKEHKWPIKVYQADGIFAMLVSNETEDIKYIPKILSKYNELK